MNPIRKATHTVYRAHRLGWNFTVYRSTGRQNEEPISGWRPLRAWATRSATRVAKNWRLDRD